MAVITSLTGPLAHTLSTLLLACHRVGADFAEFVWPFFVVVMPMHLFHFPFGFFITPISVLQARSQTFRVGGCVSERRRREDRGAAGAEGGGHAAPSQTPPPQKIFEFLK